MKIQALQIRADFGLTRGRQRLSLAFFAAFMVPVAIIIHLSSEFVSIGLRELSASMLSRHLYLLIIGAGALYTVAVLAAVFASPAVRRRRLALIVAGLPFRGTGAYFIGLCFGVQAVLFAGSQALEGYPIAGGYCLASAFAAFLLCAVAALLLSVLPKHVVSALAEVYLVRSLEHGADRRRLTPKRFLARIFVPLSCTYQAVLGNRPPPISTTI